MGTGVEDGGGVGLVVVVLVVDVFIVEVVVFGVEGSGIKF